MSIKFTESLTLECQRNRSRRCAKNAIITSNLPRHRPEMT